MTTQAVKPWKKPAQWDTLRREDVQRGYVNLFGEARAPEWDAFHYNPSKRTLSDEIRTLHKAIAERDADPFVGYHVCRGTWCKCIPAPSAFRNPSPELLAMQAGKPAYGQNRRTV